LHLLENPNDIVAILTNFIYRVSFQHSADHWGIAQLDVAVQPMIIRVPWRRGVNLCWTCEPVSTKCDWFRQNCYHRTFVHWNNNRLCYDTRLRIVDYDFHTKRAQQAASLFRARMREAEKLVPPTEPPLDRISKSIEW